MLDLMRIQIGSLLREGLNNRMSGFITRVLAV